MVRIIGFFVGLAFAGVLLISLVNDLSAYFASPPEENETLGMRRGWLGSVFTRRPWRRRGLAGALIGRSLVLLRDRGMTSAALSVDADNPTRALGLYEAAGFAVHDRFVAMRKPMGGPAT